MSAERVIELPFDGDRVVQSPGLHLEIDPRHRQRTEKYHGRAKVSRFVEAPYTFEMPQGYVASDVVDINVNGLTAAKPSYRKVREAEAQLGKNSVSLGVGTALSILSPRNTFHPETFHRDGVIAVIEDLRKHFGQDVRVRLKGHSDGARTSVAVAEEMPEVVESVTLVNPGGMDGGDLVDHAMRLPRFVHHEVLPNWDILKHEFSDPRVLTDFFFYNLANPVRTAVDAISIATADIRPRVAELGKRGVKVAILNAMADRLTPNTSVHEQGGIGEQVHINRIHPNHEIGHLGPQVHSLEVALEYHDIDEELHPEEVLPPRPFAVRAMSRGIELRRPDDRLKIAKES
jgi:pimeloyl-ACP methyl ester carboxylesterase